MKKLFFILSLFMLILMVGCWEPTEDPTNEPTIVETPTVEESEGPTLTPEPVVTSIYVKNSQKQYVDIGETYNCSKLVIMAKLSDGTEIDVSDKVTFGKIDTSTKGEKKLNIKYEEFEASVTITVIVPIGLEVDSSNVKKEYEFGEKLNISNIIINSLYEDGIKLSPNFCLIGMSDPNGDFMSIDTEFSVEGEYIVFISTLGFREEFIVQVKDVNESTSNPEPEPTPDGMYVELELDLECVKRDFYNEEEFNCDNLIVYALKSDGSKEVIPSSDYKVELEEEFVDTKEYSVRFTYIGNIDFENKELIYFVNYTATNENDESTFKITMSYSGYSSYEEFEIEVTSESVPEDFIRTENGYTFAGFSESFTEWEEGSLIKIYLNKIVNGKCDLIFIEEDYTFVWYKTFDINTQINRDDYNNERPYHIPEGFEFLYWDMEETFTVTETIYTMPIFVPEGFEPTNLTEEATINNVSANAIDVNVEEFIDATPEGYSLDSITLSLNNEIINEILYVEGMESAYFTDLTVNTEYEVGAYYTQNQATTLAFRKSRQLTYRFHFVGFMVVTKGDVMYRVRMTYQGDTLYRWYYAENTYVSNYYFFYDFTLPIEYDGYTCVGCEEFIGDITSDMDLEVVLIPPASDTCTVVFYTVGYPSDKTILKTEVVSKGGTATPPEIIQSYIEGNYEYVFSKWYYSYENVTDNVFTYPVYNPTPLIVPTIRLSLIVGDTYCFYMAETDLVELNIPVYVTIMDSSNNLVWYDFIFAGAYYNSYYSITNYGSLEKNSKYTISFSPDYHPISVIGELSCDFTTRNGTEILGYDFDAKAVSSNSYSLNMNYLDVRSYVEYRKNSNGDVIEFGLLDRYEYKKHNTTYYINPICDVKDQNDENDWNDNIMYAYFDDITVTTMDATIPTLTSVEINTPQGEISVSGSITDNSLLVKSIILYFKLTENSNYISEYISFDSSSNIDFSYTIDLSVVDPDTGITYYYEVEDAYLIVRYIYDGTLKSLKYELGE